MANIDSLRSITHVHPEGIRQLLIPDHHLTGVRQRERHLENQVTVQLGFERTRPITESAIRTWDVSNGALTPIPHAHRVDHLRDLGSVRTHVLDRGRTHETGDATQRREATAPELQRALHEGVPVLTGPYNGMHETFTFLKLHTRTGNLHDGSGEVLVVAHDVGTTADHQDRCADVVALDDRFDAGFLGPRHDPRIHGST